MRISYAFIPMQRIGAWVSSGRKYALTGIFLLCSLLSVAADFVPVEGTKYMIRCNLNKKFVLHNAACVADGVTILSTWDQYDIRSFFLISGNATDGYTIRNAQNSNLYVYAVNTNDAESNVGIKTLTEGDAPSDDCLWKIVERGNSGWNIIPKNGNNGWNCRGTIGGNGCVGQWSNNTKEDNTWQILSPADMGMLIFEEKTSTIGFPVLSEEVRSIITTAGNNLNENLTTENVTAFNNAINAPSDNHLYLPTGYYKMKCVDTSRREYLYNDYLLAANTDNLTLQSEAPSTVTNNYIWHVTNNGTSIDIINGQGTFLTSKKDGNKSIHSTLHFYNYVSGKQGIYFTEAINCCNGNPFLLSDGTHHLTTWTGGGHTANDNRWLYDAVDESAVYPVTITGLSGDAATGAYLTRTSTGEIAFDGGFFYLGTAPSAADFTASDVEGYPHTVSVENHSIKVVYQSVKKGVRVTSLKQLKTGSKVVIRNAGSLEERTGFVHESGTNLLINNGATSLKGLSYDYVFTLTDYNANNGTCYLTARSGRKVAGAYTANSDNPKPMQTVDEPAGKITLLTEGTYKWDLKYGNNTFFNNLSNATDGPFVNTWTEKDDGPASWEIYMVDEELDFEPVGGAAYYIDCLAGNNGRAAYLPGASSLLQTPDGEALHLGNLFSIEAVEGDFGATFYHIDMYADGNSHVYYANTNDANGNVGVTTDAAHDNRKWIISQSKADNQSGFNIIPANGRNGWNFRGTETVWNKGGLGQWSENNQATNTWNFVSVSDEEVTAAANTYKEVVPGRMLDVVGGMPRTEYETRIAQLSDLAAIFNAPNAIPAQWAQEEGSVLIKPQSASGLFKIKNRQLNKYLFQETNGNEKNLTYINDGGDDGKHYFKVTFEENNNRATIVASNGKPLARGNQSAIYANATTVVVSPVSMEYCGAEGYFLFPDTHSTAQNPYTRNNANYDSGSNPYFLTTWNQTTGAANQYTFEPVELPEDLGVYTVVYAGDERAYGATVTYNGAGYSGNATVDNGGFYILSAAPAASDFEVTGYETDVFDANVTIEGNTVKVTFADDAANVEKYNKWEELRTEILKQDNMTPSSMTDMSGMSYSTNAQMIHDGADGTLVNSGCLNDNNTSTYFHSTYGGTNPNAYHYLQIDLGRTDCTEFSFETTRRNENNRPTEMDVQASTDGETFSTLYTLQGIPIENNVFRSPVYPLNGQRYLRFVVKATNTGADFGGYPFFTYSEFHINTTKGVLPEDLAASCRAADKAALDVAYSEFDVTKDYPTILSDMQTARQNAHDCVLLGEKMETTKKYVELEGEGVGHYTCSNKEEQADAYAAVVAAINAISESSWLDYYTGLTAEERTALKEQEVALTWALNMPESGRVYLISSAVPGNNRYVKSAATGNPGLVTCSESDYSEEKACLLKYNADGTLVPVYGKGQFRIDGATHIEFISHATQTGKYTIHATDGTQKYAYNATGSETLDQSTTNEENLQAVNSAWTLEPVESYPVTSHSVGDGRYWATFYTDKAVYLPDGMQARYVNPAEANPVETGANSKIYTLVYKNIEEENNILPANTGVLLVAAAEGEFTLCVSRKTPAVGTPSGNVLVGWTTDHIVEEGELFYALGKPKNHEAGFYKLAVEKTMPANRAFLDASFLNSASTTSAAVGFIFVDDDDATGVQEVRAVEDVREDGVYYDLTGKRVVNPTQRGVYIKNGKKWIIK